MKPTAATAASKLRIRLLIGMSYTNLGPGNGLPVFQSANRPIWQGHGCGAAALPADFGAAGFAAGGVAGFAAGAGVAGFPAGGVAGAGVAGFTAGGGVAGFAALPAAGGVAGFTA